MAVAGEKILIGAAYRTQQQLVAHRAAIDEKELFIGKTTVERRQADVAGQGHLAALGGNGQGIVGEVAAHNLGQPRQTGIEEITGGGGQHLRRAAIGVERKGYMRMGHGQTLYRLQGAGGFGACGLEEFEPRRGSVEQIRHLHPGATGERRRFGR